MPEPLSEACGEIEHEPAAAAQAVPERHCPSAREARLFYATLRERLDAAVEELLGRIARDVLVRELQLAPCDIGQLVARVHAAYVCHHPLRVRVHPGDAEDAASCGLPVFADETLERGDAVLELRDASVDARLQSRIVDLLERPDR